MNYQVQTLDTVLPEIKIVTARRIGDTRGFFSEVWNARDFAAAGMGANFVQDNHVHSPLRGKIGGYLCHAC
jgi:dTDP-4-dehydrorhamnose 3,5-epimerase